jgi:hypothetical protein
LDALTNPSLQRLLPIVIAVVGALGAAMFLGVLWTGRRPMPPQARVFRKRMGAVGLFVVVAAGAAYALLRTPVEPGVGAVLAAAPVADVGAEAEVVSPRRFSSTRLPALELDAPDGWKLELDAKARKLVARNDNVSLLVSTAILTDAVDVEEMLRQMAETQRELGFDVGEKFSEPLGGLPAAGFVATGQGRSVCTWMIKRDTHLASSAICTAEGKLTAREACRDPLAKLRWRTPERGPR